jgi:hypothetical protein
VIYQRARRLHRLRKEKENIFVVNPTAMYGSSVVSEEHCTKNSPLLVTRNQTNLRTNMPVIRYWLQVQDDVFSETDIFLPVHSIQEAYAMVHILVVDELIKHRQQLGEPPIRLDRVEIIHPYKHKHQWKATRDDKYACKRHYACQRCGITGWRRLTIFNGESHAEVNRNEEYRSSKLEFCCDPLTKLPKLIKL